MNLKMLIICGVFLFLQNFAKATYQHPNQKQRIAIFNELLEKIDEFHIFSEMTQENLKFKWIDNKAQFRKWFVGAKNKEELLWAILKLQNSLHDKHCSGWRHYKQYSGYRAPYFLGFKVAVEKNKGKFRYYVSEKIKGIEAGDLIELIDGMTPKKYVERFIHLSSSNNWEHVYQDLGYYITHRVNDLYEYRSKEFSEILFRGRKSNKTYIVKFKWKEKEKQNRDRASELEYSENKCHDRDDIDYGGYKLDSFGNNYCIYLSKQKELKDYPIVRFFSFYYGDTNFIRTDYFSLKRWITGQKLKGIIFDFRENHGGNNPNFFMDWFSNRSYTDNFVKMKINDYLANPNVLRDSMLWGSMIDWYMKEWSEKKKRGEKYTSMRPFFCNKGDCYWDNKYTPKHLLTKKPLVIITGPECVSSCDSVVYHLSMDKVLPIIGQRSAAAYTSHRLTIPIINPADKKVLGQFTYAVSTDHDGNTKKPIEGYAPPLYMEVLENFENKDYYDELLVRKAIEAIKSFKY